MYKDGFLKHFWEGSGIPSYINAIKPFHLLLACILMAIESDNDLRGPLCSFALHIIFVFQIVLSTWGVVSSEWKWDVCHVSFPKQKTWKKSHNDSILGMDFPMKFQSLIKRSTFGCKEYGHEWRFPYSGDTCPWHIHKTGIFNYMNGSFLWCSCRVNMQSFHGSYGIWNWSLGPSGWHNKSREVRQFSVHLSSCLGVSSEHQEPTDDGTVKYYILYNTV